MERVLKSKLVRREGPVYTFETNSKQPHLKTICLVLGSVQMLSNPNLKVGDECELIWTDMSAYHGWVVGRKE